ncbi:hypothetical protein PFMC_03957 [Plasmodium falciparum CAMP/Malaysia]|uniref:Uncharacterized protein n=1 Tax=Plasmodium falciparum (isolate Camp / Malaysia) TaxID=5835 RepID=A0A024X514_PLAFC|nr:hypothetical protein PFMC_03957 [Plasmodium falciparum CAMP/Malaysia]
MYNLNNTYRFKNISCPLIQIKNKTLIIQKKDKKIYFKNFNMIDHYFKPARGLLINILDHHTYNSLFIYVDVYIVAYKVDILIERFNRFVILHILTFQLNQNGLHI